MKNDSVLVCLVCLDEYKITGVLRRDLINKPNFVSFSDRCACCGLKRESIYLIPECVDYLPMLDRKGLLKIKELETLALYTRLSAKTFCVERIARREEGKGFRCELNSNDLPGVYGVYMTLHTDAPLEWDKAYQWDDLRQYPCWIEGQKVPVRKQRLTELGRSWPVPEKERETT